MTAAALRIDLPDEATLIEAQELAERQGLVLITDGRELKYCPAHQIPLGHHRFAVVDRDAQRMPSGREPRA